MKRYSIAIAAAAKSGLAILMMVVTPGLALADATLVNIATDATDPSNLADTEPSIAVNPLNPLEIAVVTFSEGWSGGGSAPIWKSNDGGMTWRKVFQLPQPSPGSAGPGDQKIGFDGNGRLFVTELAKGVAPPRCLIYRQTGLPDGPLTLGVLYGDDQPHLDVDRAPASPCLNRLYSPWLNFGVPLERSTVSNSNNGGAAMNNVGAGDNSVFRNRTTRVALAPDGKAYIIYKTREGAIGAEPNSFQNAHFRVNRSDDCGGTWNALGAAGVSVHGPAAVQTFFTNQFGNPLKGKVARARSSDAWIAADPGDGDIYAVYVSRDASGFGQIYVARSTNQGANWTSTRVTDGTHHAAYPEIAVAANGTIGVLYIDFDDSGQSTIFRHRLARSFNDGAAWTDQILQSMDPGPINNAPDGFLWGDYEGITAVGNTFYGVFTGKSTGRKTLQMDPIFFKETALQAAEDPFQYAAKIVCGVQKDPGDMRLARGFYATTINIHNPANQDAKFFKKLALSFPPTEQRPGKVIRISEDFLKPDEALKVDCNDIKKRLFPSGFPSGYIEGFVVIESQTSLDVTAVYTTASLDREGNAAAHSSIDVEQIRERAPSSARGLADLIPVPDSRGFFCRRTPDGKKLIVTVKNQGTASSAPCSTEVDFFKFGKQSLATPALAPGASTDLLFDMPPNCFDPDCDFRITVDVTLQVPETDEANNVTNQTCLG